MKTLYMFLGPTLDSAKHRADIETPTGQMLIIGVKSATEGATIARKLVDEGVELVELCGAFGYGGAKKIHDAVGNEVPVGMMVHQVWNSPQLSEMVKGHHPLTD